MATIKKHILLVIGFFSICLAAIGQNPANRILYVIDSIPLLHNPEAWNQITQEDIADYNLVIQKDSLKLLGWEQVDGIAFVFTNAYRNRPDSIKRIPSLKQMVMKDNRWHFNGSVYTGRYIDYYNSGRIQNEGNLLNGKTDGELVVYYKGGIKRSVTTYKDGIRHGSWKDYYKNGVLMREDEFVNGATKVAGKDYFNNGQIKHKIKPGNRTSDDTAITYYSTGQVREMRFGKNGKFSPPQKQSDLNYYNTMFFQHLRTGDMKAANKTFYKIWLIDSTNIDTYFKEGLLLSTESRFDQAIALFDRALAIEPLMRESLEHRARARLNRFKYSHQKLKGNISSDRPIELADLMVLPEEEEEKVCRDLLLADELDPGYYNNRTVPETVIHYCKKKVPTTKVK